jgi:hypothetical protein
MQQIQAWSQQVQELGLVAGSSKCREARFARNPVQQNDKRFTFTTTSSKRVSVIGFKLTTTNDWYVQLRVHFDYEPVLHGSCKCVSIHGKPDSYTTSITVKRKYTGVSEDSHHVHLLSGENGCQIVYIRLRDLIAVSKARQTKSCNLSMTQYSLCPSELILSAHEFFSSQNLFYAHILSRWCRELKDVQTSSAPGKGTKIRLGSNVAECEKVCAIKSDNFLGFLKLWHAPNDSAPTSIQLGIVSELRHILHIENFFVQMMKAMIKPTDALRNSFLFNAYADFTMTDAYQIIDINRVQRGDSVQNLPWHNWNVEVDAKRAMFAWRMTAATHPVLFKASESAWNQWADMLMCSEEMLNSRPLYRNPADRIRDASSASWDFSVDDRHDADATRSPADEIVAMYTRSAYQASHGLHQQEDFVTEHAVWLISKPNWCSAQVLLTVNKAENQAVLLDFSPYSDAIDEVVYRRFDSLKIPPVACLDMGAFTHQELHAGLSRPFVQLLYRWMAVVRRLMPIRWEIYGLVAPPLRLNRDLGAVPLHLHAFLCCFMLNVADSRSHPDWEKDQLVVGKTLERHRVDSRGRCLETYPLVEKRSTKPALNALFQNKPELYCYGISCAADILYMMTLDTFSALQNSPRSWQQAKEIAGRVLCAIICFVDAVGGKHDFFDYAENHEHGTVAESIYMHWNELPTTKEHELLTACLDQWDAARSWLKPERCAVLVSPAEYTNHWYIRIPDHQSLRVVVHKGGFANDQTKYTPEQLCTITASAFMYRLKPSRDREAKQCDAACKLWDFLSIDKHKKNAPEDNLGLLVCAYSEFLDI